MTDVLATGLAVVLLAATLPLLGFFAHAVLVLVLGSVSRHAPAPPGGPAPFLVALVVAHDEERVILRSVRSLREQRCSPDRFAVVVVADRCTDRTEELAEGAGARVIRRPEGTPGKARVIADALRILAEDPRWGALAVFDADNVVDPDFVERLGRRLGGGSRVVQGFVDAGNPGESWVSASSALGYWAISALAQSPRERAGLSSPLMGTAFGLLREDALRHLLDAESLTDDLELGARLALDGVRVDYEHGARVVEEKPAALSTAVTQRKRWMQGRFAVAARYLPALTAAALRGGLPGPARLRAADVAIQLVAPSLSFVAVGLAGIGLAELGLSRLLAASPSGAIGAIGAWILSVGLAAYVIPAIGVARFRPPLRVWRAYVIQPVYLALSVPLGILGFFTRGSRVWKRTPKG